MSKKKFSEKQNFKKSLCGLKVTVPTPSYVNMTENSYGYYTSIYI